MKSARFTIAIILGLTAVDQSRFGSQGDADSRARQLVVDWLRVRDRTLIGGENRTFDPKNVEFERQASTVVPGLVYWWGFYAPPGTADVNVEIAAARGISSAVLLERPSDWLKAITGVGWKPPDPQSALGACSEAVELTGPRASHLVAPFLYNDSASLDNEHLLPAAAHDLRKTHRLTPPTMRYLRGAWQGEFWMVEAGQTTHYECRLDDSVIVLAAKESIPGIGLLPLGP